MSSFPWVESMKQTQGINMSEDNHTGQVVNLLAELLGLSSSLSSSLSSASSLHFRGTYIQRAPMGGLLL